MVVIPSLLSALFFLKSSLEEGERVRGTWCICSCLCIYILGHWIVPCYLEETERSLDHFTQLSKKIGLGKELAKALSSS